MASKFSCISELPGHLRNYRMARKMVSRKDPKLTSFPCSEAKTTPTVTHSDNHLKTGRTGLPQLDLERRPHEEGYRHNRELNPTWDSPQMVGTSWAQRSGFTLHWVSWPLGRDPCCEGRFLKHLALKSSGLHSGNFKNQWG